ncbi:MAG: LemA family protein [Tepidisphaeraceae bacterium]
MLTPILIAVVAVFVVVVLWLVLAYNGLVTLRNRYLNAFSQIDVQLKRRYDLIPNLVEAVKGYMAHERQTLEAVTAARGQAQASLAAASANPSDSTALNSLFSAEQGLVSALGRFRMIAEAYPTLKADRSVGGLMEELSSTENRVAFARQAYNDSVMVYNTRVQTVPTNVVAGIMGFRPAPLFQIDDQAQREAVQVKLS